MLTKIKQIAWWVITNGALAVSLYYGIHHGIAGARNIAIFLIWFSFIGAFMFASKAGIKKLADDNFKPSVPQNMNLMFDACILTVLLWYGWIWCAIAWFIHIMLQCAAIDGVEKELKRRESGK